MSIINYEKTTGPKVRPIVVWPDKRLKQKCAPFHAYDFEYNNDLHQLAADLYWTMRSQNGIGLAAPQIGVNRRMIVIQQVKQVEVGRGQQEENSTYPPSYETFEDPLILINPEITSKNNKTFTWDEGCLSTPGYFETRTRPETITVRAQSFNGLVYEKEYTGLTAFCIQHEIDHLDGICFVDNSSLLKKQIAKRKITKTLKHTNRVQEQNVDVGGT